LASVQPPLYFFSWLITLRSLTLCWLLQLAFSMADVFKFYYRVNTMLAKLRTSKMAASSTTSSRLVLSCNRRYSSSYFFSTFPVFYTAHNSLRAIAFESTVSRCRRNFCHRACGNRHIHRSISDNSPLLRCH
jgi:hypothetical protein